MTISDIVRKTALTSSATLFLLETIACGACSDKPATQTPIVTQSPTPSPTVTYTPNPTHSPSETTTPTPTNTQTPTPDPELPVYNLEFMQNCNPELIDFLSEQEWYQDGVDYEEALFLRDGLGGLLTSKGAYVEENIFLKHIAANKQYKIEPIKLNGGTKNLIVMYDEEWVFEPCKNLLLAAAPLVEDFLGMTYPKDSLVAYVRDNISLVGASNGTLTLSSTDFRKIGESGIREIDYKFKIIRPVHESVHSFWLTDSQGGRGGNTRLWLNEGLAEFGGWSVLEQISSNPMTTVVDGVDFSVQEICNRYSLHFENKGYWERPLMEIGGENYSRMDSTLAGFFVFADLQDMLGKDAFTAALGDIYSFKEPLKGPVVDESVLHEYMRKHASDKEAVDKYFVERVFL